MKLKKSAVGNLHIVDGAGLEFNKKDRSMNRNAGLRTKSKSPDGVSRVKRRKPLAIKHIRRLRKVGIAAASVALCAVVGVGFGFFTSSPIQELPDVDYATVCYEVPENAGSPLSHSVIENVGYLNYVLKNQPYWSSEMQSNVSTIMSQTVKTYKKFYNGTLISADIAQGVSSTATQFCVADDVVLWRSSANKNFNGMDTEWSTKAPNGLTVPQYKKQRGLPPSEFSVYILNENTVKNANDFSVKDNGDGTFTMSLDLSVSTDDGLTSADYYYRQQMYVTGGLDERPTMNEASVTYTFDAEWRILSFSIYEDYTAKLAVPAPCTAETHTKFFYEEEKAKNTFYDDYFKHHIDSFTVADDVDNSAPSALNYLAAAFGSVLNDGATFKITAAVGNLDLDGVIHVGLNDGALEDIRVKIGDISVFMGADNVLYISDGNAKYKLDISAFSSSQASAEGDGGGLELNSILETLTEGEFTVTETGAKLDTQLELFGIKAKLHFTFDTTSGAVALGNVTAEVMLGSTPVNAALSFGTKDDIPSKPQDMSGYIDILKEGLTLKASLKLENFDLSGYIKILMSDGAFSGIYATLDDICVYFDYPHNMLYVTDGNVKYKVSVADLASGNIDLSGLDINGILGQIIQKLETSEDTISTGITLELFEQAITAALKVKLSGGINVGAEVELFGIKVTANVALTNEEVTLPVDLDSYADILNEGITLDVNLKVENFVLDGKVFIGLTDGKFTEIRADFKDIAIYYNNNVLYVTDGNVKYKVSVADLASGNIDLSGLDINGILGQIIQKLETSEDTISTGITLELFEQAITAALKVKLSGGINVGAEVELFGIKVTANVALTTEEVTLPVDLDSYVDILNEGITLDVNLKVENFVLDGKVFIGLTDGKFTEIRADFKDIAIYYNKNVLYVTDGNVKYKVSVADLASGNIDLSGLDINGILGQIIQKLETSEDTISTGITLELFEQAITAALKVKLSGGINVGAEVELFGIKVTVNVALTNEEVTLPDDLDSYADILNEGITLDVNLKVENLVLDGKVFIGLTDGKFTEIRADFKDFAIYYNNNVLYVTDGNVKYKVSVADLASGNIDLSGLDINGILGQIIQKLETSEDTISTGITLELFEQAITAALKVKLSGGINVGAEVELFGIKVTANVALTTEEVTLPVDLDSYVDILNEGITLDVGLIIDEKGNLGDGALQLNGKVTLDLIGGKLNQVKADFGEIAVYYNATQKTLFVKIADTKLKINLPETDTANIGDIGELLPDGMSNVLSELIKNLIVGAKEISTNANIPLGKEFLPVSANITLENGIGAVLETTLFGINATVTVGLSNEAVADVSDIDEYIDVVENIWGAVESIIGNSLSVNVSGNITNDGAVKYSFDALLEYDFNPVTYDADGNEIKKPAVNLNTGKVNENGVREGVSLSVDSEIYLHFNLALISAVEGADNLSLDLVVMDATPSNSTNGVTDGGYVKDGVLDIYLSVSKYASDSENYDPLMIYAPMDDILTLVSMVAAMANLDNISFEDNDELNSAVAEISGIIDSLLIDNYIPYTKDQFSSLGDSLIPQILGKSLKDYIGELLGSLKNTADDVVQNGDSQTESTISLNKDYVKSIACGNDSLKLTLDSSLIYGTDVEGDISVELIKGITADEKTRLTGVYLDNVYFGDKNTDKLALGVELSYGNIQRPDESAALGGYTNFNGVSDLLKAFVNSATHKTEEGETSYELNDYFLLQGKVNVNISVIGINIGVELNINSLSIKIDENNNVAVDAHLSYQGVQMLGQIAINGDSDVYLSIVNDMIYLKRIQKTYWEKSGLVTNKKTYATPVVEYRVMPLSAFSEDIMNEIVFIFNFGSLVSDQLTNIDSSSGTGANFENRDLGNLFKYVLAYYTTEQTSSYKKWNFAINGKLLSDLVGMTMSNIPITFIADKNEDGTLTVTGLDIAKSTMDLVSGIVSMNFDGNLRYCNPNGVIAEINGKPVYADSSLSLDSCKIPELGGRSFNSVLGGNNFADIVKKTDWAKLTSDLSLTYFKLDSSTPITVVDAKAEYTLNTDNTKFQTLVELDGILYNTATNTSYSTYVLPEVSELLPVEGEKYWDEVYDSTMKTLTYSAIYQPVFIDILSDINMTGASYDENLGKYVKSLKYGVGAKVELPLLVSAPSSYKFMGYYDNPEFTGMPLTEITVSGDAVYYAKWEGKNINLSYLSDVNANGEITTLQTESMVFGQQYSLAPMSVENHVFLGWFAQTDDGFVSIADGAALTEYSKWLFGESDSLDVNLYAVFVKNEIVIDITEVSGTQWKILGNYYIAYAEGISEQIANSAQVECSVAVTYYAHGKKLFGSSFSYDEIGKANFSGMSGSLNKTGMNCGNAVGGKNLRGSVKISASFSCGGIALGSTSEFEQFKDKS